jgi:hypothetical protein
VGIYNHVRKLIFSQFFFFEMLLDSDVNGNLEKIVEIDIRKFLGNPYKKKSKIDFGLFLGPEWYRGSKWGFSVIFHRFQTLKNL